ncbi:hypothetical protein CYMTET_32615 [Cymbomonas tetramitiformis]|uniref:Uncharacterized protein n=1 Tax=Cymbomonas tetramitiformis TaxID=36881 RepID=A0AAE0KS14_9CHLO|nr:hypothetical protein CYMTET_32615 [Cymbomonas tetramitiformis]
MRQMSAPSPGSFGRVVLSCDKCQWVGAGIQLSSKRIVGPAAQGQQTPSGPGSPNISTRRRCLSIHAGGQGNGGDSKLGIACVSTCKACIAGSSDIEAHITAGGCLEEVQVI